MRLGLLSFLVILGVFCLSVAAQGSYEDCCLRYVKQVKPAIISKVSSYRKQELDGGCNKPAIVFKLRHGRMFCADPKEQWVNTLMTKVDSFLASGRGKPVGSKNPTKKKKGSRG